MSVGMQSGRSGQPDVRSVSQTVAGRQWRWLAAGPADGPPVVLIHGAGGTADKWAPQVAGLAAGGCCVLAPDLPGHGGSDGPAASSITTYAELLGEWLSALGLCSAGLVGHSMGGAIVQEFALQGQPAAWLGLVGTGARLRVHPDTFARLGDTEVPSEYLAAAFGVRPDPDLLAAESETWQTTDPAVRIADFEACDTFDAIGRLSSLHAPTLIVVGREDRMTPVKYAKFLADEINNARLVVIDNAGHYVQLEQPEPVTNALLEMATTHSQ